VQDYWKPSLQLLNEKDFLARLKGYDKDSIPPKLIAAIRSGYLTNEMFTPEAARKASAAAEGMCKWVHAMSSYDKVAKVSCWGSVWVCRVSVRCVHYITVLFQKRASGKGVRHLMPIQ
jgi:hypothetical protein